MDSPDPLPLPDDNIRIININSKTGGRGLSSLPSNLNISKIPLSDLNVTRDVM